MKQTAVEWLENELDFLCNYMGENDRLNLFEQAKEMEKEQTINFANDFYDDCVMDGGSLQQSAEEYYNDIF
jgi:hypothetical protein